MAINKVTDCADSGRYRRVRDRSGNAAVRPGGGHRAGKAGQV